MFNRIRKCMLLALMLAGIGSRSFAGEMDMLLEKLVEKGILTQGEALQISNEVKEEVQKEVVQGISSTIPSFIQNTKFKGDMRLRFQHTHTDKGTGTDRSRYRYRLRYGFETKISDTLAAGLNLAAGTGEQTSTNQTMADTFNQKSIWIDKAYMTYAPNGYISLTGGKIANPFHTAGSDLIWDTDITPEGFAALINIPAGKADFFFRTGFFPLDENAGVSNDPALFALQAGAGVKSFWNFKLGLAWYDFMNIKNNVAIEDMSPSHNKRTNTMAEAGGKNYWVYDYKLLNANVEVTPWTGTIAGNPFPLKFYGDYVNNNASSVKEGTGWLVGATLGKAGKKGTWDFGYNYRRIEKDAVLATLNDSDFHGGGTNGEGHKLSFNCGLTDNATLGLTYFKTSEERGAKYDDNVLLVDCVVKF